jgi:uncharacterized membrane protein
VIRLLFWIIAGVIGAGLVHGVSVLMIPFVAPATAYDRLATIDADGKFALLPDPAPQGQVLPFEDPSFIEAACRYDLTDGPLRVFAPFADSYGSVTFYTRFGQAYYSLTDRAASQDGVNVIVLDPAHVDVPEEDPAAPNQGQALRIVSPTHLGFVVLRLHVPGPSARDVLKALAATARCATAQTG